MIIVNLKGEEKEKKKKQLTANRSFDQLISRHRSFSVMLKSSKE